MRQIFIYSCLIFIAFSCSKDSIDELNVLPPELAWEKSIYQIYEYDDSLRQNIIIHQIQENKYAIERTSDNGFVIAVNGYIDKYNAEGDSLWSKNFSGEVSAIQILTNNEYLLGGTKDGNIWIAKTDDNWNILWEQSLGTSVKEVTAMEETPDGVVIAGLNGSNSWLTKLDDNGTILWEQKFERSGLEEIQAVEIAQNGNILTIGNAGDIGIYPLKGGTDIWITNISADGNIIWEKIYGGAGNDEGHGIQQNADGNFIISGQNTEKYNNSWIATIDETGTVQSEDRKGNSNFHIFDEMPNGDFILLGTYYTNGFMGTGSSFLSFAKINDNAERVWQRNVPTYYSFNENRSIAATQLTDGSYVTLTTDSDFDDGFYSLYKIMAE